MLKIDPTPGGILAKKISQKLSKCPNMPKIYVRENAGPKLSALVTNTVKLGKSKKCSRIECFVYMSQGQVPAGGLRCSILGVTYEIRCKICAQKGVTTTSTEETATTGYIRALNHATGFLKGYSDNVMHLHHLEHHGKERKQLNNFTFKVTGHYNMPCERQSAEGILISQRLKDRDKSMFSKPNAAHIILNSRRQFHQPGMMRQTIRKDDYN